MKQLTCEMCGSTDLMKQEGVFVCQTCGCKYSVEDAKKMMIEGTVEVTGTVQVDKSNQIDNLLKNIEILYSEGKYEEVYSKCQEVLDIDFENPKAMLYRGFAEAWKTNGKSNYLSSTVKGLERAINLAKKKGENEVIGSYIDFASRSMMLLIPAILKLNLKILGIELENLTNLSTREINLGATAYTGRALEDYLRKCEERFYAEQKVIDKEFFRKANDLYSIANDLAEVMIKGIDNPADCKDVVFSLIKRYINFYKNSGDFSEYASDSVKNRCNLLLNKVDQLEKKGRHERVERYWEAHKEEKEELIEKIKEQDEIIKSANEQVNAFQPRIDEVESRKNEYLSKEQEISKLKDQIGDLVTQRSRLGIFQGKQKKEVLFMNNVNLLGSKLMMQINNEKSYRQS